MTNCWQLRNGNNFCFANDTLSVNLLIEKKEEKPYCKIEEKETIETTVWVDRES